MWCCQDRVFLTRACSRHFKFSSSLITPVKGGVCGIMLKELILGIEDSSSGPRLTISRKNVMYLRFHDRMDKWKRSYSSLIVDFCLDHIVPIESYTTHSRRHLIRCIFNEVISWTLTLRIRKDCHDLRRTRMCLHALLVVTPYDDRDCLLSWALPFCFVLSWKRSGTRWIITFKVQTSSILSVFFSFYRSVHSAQVNCTLSTKLPGEHSNWRADSLQQHHEMSFVTQEGQLEDIWQGSPNIHLSNTSSTQDWRRCSLMTSLPFPLFFQRLHSQAIYSTRPLHPLSHWSILFWSRKFLSTLLLQVLLRSHVSGGVFERTQDHMQDGSRRISKTKCSSSYLISKRPLISRIFYVIPVSRDLTLIPSISNIVSSDDLKQRTLSQKILRDRRNRLPDRADFCMTFRLQIFDVSKIWRRDLDNLWNSWLCHCSSECLPLPDDDRDDCTSVALPTCSTDPNWTTLLRFTTSSDAIDA